MRRRGFTIWSLLLVLTLVIVAALILLPVFARLSERSGKHNSCQSNLKQIALGFKQYLSDWDDKYPLISVKDTGINEKNPLGWADALDPYLKSRQVFWCPDQIRYGKRDETEKQPSARDYTDYYYNRRLAGIYEDKITQSPLIILLGEGNDGTDAANARYSLSNLPPAWKTDKTSPLYRHLDGANYAFTDGHSKWIKPNHINDKKPDAGSYTFAIK